ncbi:ankyrin repeat domain-containing protein [Novipirellula sp. SH528]|uniref:ankyrin repeat domain-containing protein n=1 Tax=Novipirellula sp. SH528 TaxID=3454466 RepID=UPI003F9EEDB5
MTTSALAKKLYRAVLDRNAKAIEKLAKPGVDVDEPYADDDTDSQRSALLVAATRVDVPCAQALIDAGANVNFKELPAKKPKPGFGYNLFTPLHCAAQTGSPQMVQLLVDHGAAVNAVDDHGDTALMEAVGRCDGKKHFQVIEILVRAGANPTHTPGRNGASYLVCAADKGDSMYRRGLIKLLVDCGADPNAACGSRRKICPLHAAICEGSLKGVTELLENGADPTVKAPKTSKHDWSGLSALDYAKAVKAKKSIVSLLANWQSVTKPNTAGAAKRASASKSKPLPTASKAWDAIEAALEMNNKRLFKSLAKGAKKSDITTLVSKTKIRLTNEVKEFFLRHNGQTGTKGLIVDYASGEEFRLLSIDEVIKEWTIWEDLAQSGDFDDSDAVPDAGIRECWWHPKWLPMAGNTAGDFLCFDNSPAKGGKNGQVITLWHADSARNVVYPSIRDMLAAISN